MGYFIALDAGGTKTETLLLDESGRILLRDISLGCNAMDMGLEEALRRAGATRRQAGLCLLRHRIHELLWRGHARAAARGLCRLAAVSGG